MVCNPMYTPRDGSAGDSGVSHPPPPPPLPLFFISMETPTCTRSLRVWPIERVINQTPSCPLHPNRPFVWVQHGGKAMDSMGPALHTGQRWWCLGKVLGWCFSGMQSMLHCWLNPLPYSRLIPTHWPKKKHLGKEDFLFHSHYNSSQSFFYL